MLLRMVALVTVACVAAAELAAGDEAGKEAANQGQTSAVKGSEREAATPSDEAKSASADQRSFDDDDAEGSSLEEKAIREIVRQVESAFNQHDSMQLSAMFCTHAEVIGAGGEVTSGRDEIRQLFEEEFESNPEVSMSIQIDSIRVLSPTVAIEEGTTRVVSIPGEDEQLARYAVVYTKEDDSWKMISARDIPVTAAVDSRLQQLEWLVGEWVDECDECVVRTSYRWSRNHHFLIGEFEVTTPFEGVMYGTSHIGWDPQMRQIRSWIFDSEGGFATGLWARNADAWVVKLTGVLHDGRTTTATHRFTRLSNDHAELESTDRVIGGELIDDGNPVSMVRLGPAPQSVSSNQQSEQP